MFVKLTDYLTKINCFTIVSDKGIVIPPKMDNNSNWGGMDGKQLIQKLSPLLPEGLRVSLLKPTFEYPEPAIFIGLSLSQDIDKSNENTSNKLESLLKK